MKKFTSIILAVLLCLSFTVTAFAQEVETTPDYLTSFISRRNANASIETVVPMYSVNNETIAWLYILDPVGYIITDSSKNIIVEFSFSAVFEYDESKSLYFGGPTQYYKKIGNSFCDIKTGTILSINEIANRSSRFVTTTMELSQANSGTSIAAYSMPTVAPLSINAMDKDDFPLYCNNSDGRCGSVAAAILLAYYNNNGYSGLVSDTHYDNELAFTNYLYNHIEGLDSTAGSSTSDLVSGLNWYLQQKDFDSQLSAYSKSEGSFSFYTDKIDSNVPVILDLDDDPHYSEHWVVGYGYDYDQFIIQYNKFAIVNDGHGENEIEINWDYVGDFVYLK